MKRILVSFAVFLSLFSLSSATVDSFDFDMTFEKVGISDIHFERNGSIVSSTTFPITGNYVSTTDIVYKIYPGEAVELIFVSGSATEADYLENGTMLTSIATDLGEAGIKLNYDVSLSSGGSIVFDNDTSTSYPGRQEDVPISYRTLQVAKAVDDELSGKETMTLTVNPPAREDGEEGFIAGQYTGYVIMRLYTLE